MPANGRWDLIQRLKCKINEVIETLRNQHENKNVHNIRSGRLYYEILVRTLVDVRKSV